MLGSIKLMNAIIVVVSAAEPIEKKPQLIQHLAAVKLSGIKNVLVCLNKLDLIDKETATKRYQDLVSLLNRFDIVPKKIIPTSFNKGIGISWLLEEIMEHFILDEKEERLTVISISEWNELSDWDKWFRSELRNNIHLKYKKIIEDEQFSLLKKKVVNEDVFLL